MWAPAAATAQTRDMTAESGTTLGIRTKIASTMMTMSSPWAKARGMATDGREKNTDTRRHKITDTRRRRGTNTRRRKTTTEVVAEDMGTTLIEVANKAGEAQVDTVVVTKEAPAQGADADTAQTKAEGSGQTRIVAPARTEARANALTQRKGLAGVAAPMDGLPLRHRMPIREVNTEAWIRSSSTNGSAKQCWKKSSGTRGHHRMPPQLIGDSMSRKTINRPCCGASTGRSNISSPNRRRGRK